MISIICPIYNKERYIAQTIKSVIDQTSSQWELLLVDDGSTDGSLAAANEQANGDSRIHLVSRKDYEPGRRGANVCRNIGIEHSKGEYVVFLDADDVLLPHCIEQRLAVAESKSGYDLYIFNVAYTMGYDRAPFAKVAPSSDELYNVSKAKDLRRYFLRRLLLFDLPWHTSGPLWKKEKLVALGGFDEDFQRLQDPEIHTRALLDKSIRLNYQMASMPYDVLHLKDEQRVVWNALQFYEKQIEAIRMYINKFVPIIKDVEGKAYLKHLQGYLIFGETLSYRFIRDDPNSAKVVRQRLKDMYSNAWTKETTDLFYDFFISLYRLSLQSAFLKLKVPGFLLSLYKKVILQK